MKYGACYFHYGFTIKGVQGCHGESLTDCFGWFAVEFQRLSNSEWRTGRQTAARVFKIPHVYGGQSEKSSVRVGVAGPPSEDICKSDELKDRWRQRVKTYSARGGRELGNRRRRGRGEKWKAANAANCGFESFALWLNYSSLLPDSLVLETKTAK